MALLEVTLRRTTTELTDALEYFHVNPNIIYNNFVCINLTVAMVTNEMVLITKKNVFRQIVDKYQKLYGSWSAHRPLSLIRCRSEAFFNCVRIAFRHLKSFVNKLRMCLRLNGA